MTTFKPSRPYEMNGIKYDGDETLYGEAGELPEGFSNGHTTGSLNQKLLRTSQMKKLQQVNSEITIGVGKRAQAAIREQAEDYLRNNADEFRKNSHLQHWAPPEIF